MPRDQKMERVGDLEKKYLLEVMASQFGNSRSAGMNRRLEEKFASAFGARYAIAQASGTATLHSALKAVGIKEGMEVIVPPLTMMSTTFSVFQAGGVPVYADVDPDTFLIDPEKIQAAITDKTRAIMPVSLFGLPVNIDEIMKIARDNKLYVIEDNAQCYRGFYQGRIAGSVGHMASYSMQISKHLTAGEGGMLITNDENLALRARRFGNLGYAPIGASSGRGRVTKDMIQNPEYDRHIELGWNYRMSEPSAAVALAQTERMEELVHMRAKVAALIKKAHEGCSWLKPQFVPEGYIPSWWAYVLKLENKKVAWVDFRRKYMELGGDGIYACWKLSYLEPFLKGKKSGNQKFEKGLCPVAESLQPFLLQFKTNYMDLDVAQRQANILEKTIEYFEG